MVQNNILTCPICGEKHNISDGRGNLIETITCSCKQGNIDTEFFWVSSGDYYYYDANYRLCQA